MLTYDLINKNKRESWILIFSFLIVISALGWVFAQVYQNDAILYLAVIFSVGSALFSYYFADSITLAVSKAQPVDRASNQQLYNIVENLCITAGIPTPKIYIIPDSAPNAFATGRDPQHAVICFTAGILQKLNKTELEGVTAHELSHIGNYDIRLMTLVVVLVGMIALMSNWFLRFSFFGGRRSSSRDNNNIGMILFAVGILLAILSPLIATIIKLAVSRQREYLADASGALLTRYPEGLAAALEKISGDQAPLAEANNATAHLYIVNPFHEDRAQSTSSHPENPHGARSWLAGLFNTHPPIEDRIKRLRGMNL
ncbi:MAG: M48 family metallopeptidase [Candidatus Doudnabacteria bacterium]|nr:M48 family metallopeptidase [Candidatus Doudnabacteria bacterium]